MDILCVDQACSSQWPPSFTHPDIEPLVASNLKHKRPESRLSVEVASSWGDDLQVSILQVLRNDQTWGCSGGE